MTDTNELVYGLTIPGINNFRTQEYNGKHYITYWSGQRPPGGNIQHGYGNVTFIDDEYNVAFTVCPPLNITTDISPVTCEVDFHEQLTVPSRGTILLSGYSVEPADLTSVNGSANGYVQDSTVYEVDIATEEVVFSWSALDHIPVSASRQPLISDFGNGTKASAYDYFHINTIDPVGDDYFLINARHTWTTYLISRVDGSVFWELNGETGGDFGALPELGKFRWQHDSRAHNVTDTSFDISYFNNYNSENGNGTAPTNGLLLRLPLPPSKDASPELLRHLETPDEEIYAISQGNHQLDLGNGNGFLGYGPIPLMREYGPANDGSDLRWEARFGTDNNVLSYRGFKNEWHATPCGWDPVLVVEKDASSAAGCGAKAYVSWNGATDVEAWNVYLGGGAVGDAVAGTVAKAGFETVFDVPATGCVQVGAFQKGAEVRRSNVVCL